MKCLSLFALAALLTTAHAQTPRDADTAPDSIRSERVQPTERVQERALRLSVQAGLLSTTFAGDGVDDLSRKRGLHLAVSGQYDLDERPYFGRLGVSFDQFGAGERGYSYGDVLVAAAASGGGASSGRGFYGDTANYLRLRALAGRRWLVTDREWPLRFGLGPDVGFLVSTNVGSSDDSLMRTLDVGAAALVELGIPMTLLSTAGEVTVGLDYTHGLTNAGSPQVYGGDLQNRAVGLKVGFLTSGRSEARPADRR